jgi:hypothetical protein
MVATKVEQIVDSVMGGGKRCAWPVDLRRFMIRSRWRVGYENPPLSYCDLCTDDDREHAKWWGAACPLADQVGVNRRWVQI